MNVTEIADTAVEPTRNDEEHPFGSQSTQDTDSRALLSNLSPEDAHLVSSTLPSHHNPFDFTGVNWGDFTFGPASNLLLVPGSQPSNSAEPSTQRISDNDVARPNQLHLAPNPGSLVDHGINTELANASRSVRGDPRVAPPSDTTDGTLLSNTVLANPSPNPNGVLLAMPSLESIVSSRAPTPFPPSSHHPSRANTPAASGLANDDSQTGTNNSTRIARSCTPSDAAASQVLSRKHIRTNIASYFVAQPKPRMRHSPNPQPTAVPTVPETTDSSPNVDTTAMNSNTTPVQSTMPGGIPTSLAPSVPAARKRKAPFQPNMAQLAVIPAMRKYILFYLAAYEAWPTQTDPIIDKALAYAQSIPQVVNSGPRVTADSEFSTYVSTLTHTVNSTYQSCLQLKAKFSNVRGEAVGYSTTKIERA